MAVRWLCESLACIFKQRGSRGSDPRLLRLTMDRLLDRTHGERPRASRLVRTLRLDLPADERADQFMAARDRLQASRRIDRAARRTG